MIQTSSGTGMARRDPAPDGAARRYLWMGLLASASVLFSYGLACATPFAALGAIAALNLGRRDAVTLILGAWLANQAIGYGILAYPQTFESFAWGAALGVAALLGTLAAHHVTARLSDSARAVVTAAAFGAAFLAFEAAVFAASLLLPGGDGAFSLPVVGQILLANVGGLAGLLILHRVGTAVGLVAGSGPRAAAAMPAACSGSQSRGRRRSWLRPRFA